jgi:hypothetical protein
MLSHRHDSTARHGKGAGQRMFQPLRNTRALLDLTIA